MKDSQLLNIIINISIIIINIIKLCGEYSQGWVGAPLSCQTGDGCLGVSTTAATYSIVNSNASNGLTLAIISLCTIGMLHHVSCQPPPTTDIIIIIIIGNRHPHFFFTYATQHPPMKTTSKILNLYTA